MNNAGFILLIVIAAVLLGNHFLVPEVHQIWIYGLFAVSIAAIVLRWGYMAIFRSEKD